ncbi:DUF2497 domain-containing protein [Rhizobium rosettiformans]|uniref:DUF2497 domain-containing protein n=1 Tax=Rhizobium rosettiformans TaxID=1368430 RepID=A0ABX7EZJ4_9HYPH|nr:DUF2497 domain-containing protein [Rhizobium rosettiformans]ODS55600.1 MAG: hypothetical protein ABS40_10630 [Agrobacterium sp. SCN 61-19]QRF52862.1 DUF2497 domain-containing protein [Rhizobium rosettiformans]
MAQPSVAREPSMEEILASIRRIIESNDPVNGGSLTEDAASLTDDQGESDEDMGYDGGEFVPANDAGSAFPLFPQRDMERAEVEPRREPVLEQASEAPKSVSLADLAARVRSASERTERPSPPQLSNTTAQVTVSQPRRDSEFSTDKAQHEAPVMSTRLSEMRDQQLRPTIAAEPAQAPVPRAEQEAERPAEPSPIARMAHVEVRAERREPAFLEPEMEQAEPSFEVDMQVSAASDDMHQNIENEGRDLTALVSAATVEQVSRSFSELAAAFDGSERRSLDEVAEEMLRPMLKDWLDDNLPTLVERLVREEIERVARGPRR